MYAMDYHRSLRVQPYLFAVCVASFLGVSTQVKAAKTPPLEPMTYYFLKDTDVGSQASFGPLQVILNSGFDILRSGAYPNSLRDIDFGTGFVNVWDNMLNPVDNIRETQPWSDFVAHEIFPYKAFNPDHGHFVPNYFLHTFGEGMLFRQLTEYYHREGQDYPKTFALLTLFGAQLLNEVVENSGHRGPNVDPIADLLIFNPLGYLLFAFEGSAHFFSNYLQISYWPGQATLSPTNAGLYNTGENFTFRVPFGDLPVGFFSYMGSEGVAGLSYQLNAEDRIQLAWGYRVVWLEDENANNPDINARMMRPVKPGNWLIGFFWDKNDSLMFSAFAGMKAEPTLRINLYPGLLKVGKFNLGAFVWTSPSEGIIAGFSFGNSPLGLGFQAGNDASYETL